MKQEFNFLPSQNSFRRNHTQDIFICPMMKFSPAANMIYLPKFHEMEIFMRC